MAGKRRATSDLNHDNWEQEEEPEDAGTFKRASQDELKRRIIKTAKRRKPVVCEDDSNKKSAFANFTALSKISAPSSSAFSFLSKLSSDVTNEETSGIKKLCDNGKNEVDQCKDKITDNKLIESTNPEINGEMGDKEIANDDDTGEKDDMDDRLTKENIENLSHVVDESTNNEISGDTDADRRIQRLNNKNHGLEEVTTEKNIDSDSMVSQDSIVSENQKANEALNDNSQKKETNIP